MTITSKILQQIALAMLFVIILGIVVFGEQQSLSSIGLHSLRWQPILWGLIFAGFLVFIYSPLLIWSMTQLGLAGFEEGLAKLESLPVWYLILAVVIGGIVEEVLYRGYAAERLSLLTGSYWIGCALSLIAIWSSPCTAVGMGACVHNSFIWMSADPLLFGNWRSADGDRRAHCD
ncbi:MAG: CPBP family intramembrane metalloprotease [Synechococcales cyanobacterium M58_A2018_015]|nr:CPBP family intramembrane metalloprotease [Synechococcales cyanobacterium M58_A2018_015]